MFVLSLTFTYRMTDPGFKRSHSSQKNDKLESHADMFQPLVFAFARVGPAGVQLILHMTRDEYMCKHAGMMRQNMTFDGVNRVYLGMYTRASVLCWAHVHILPLCMDDVGYLQGNLVSAGYLWT